jgi:predicted transposase/invertase (TIGR01784 family)
LYDTVSKYLIETSSQDFATWLLGKPCILNRLEPTELSIEPIRADALFYATENEILHLEIQTNPDPNIPFRSLDYKTRIYRKYPDKQIIQVVIYLKPTNSDLVKQTKFEIPGTVHTFQVIRLWEQPTELFLNAPGLLPLAVLSNTLNQEGTLRQVAEKIDRLENPKIQSTISNITAILAGLSLDKGLIRQILRRDVMQESVIYQEILEEGVQKGIAIGEQRGKESGRQEGRKEGITIGEQRGSKEAKAIVARNLLSIGIPVEQVATATELTLEEIQQLPK